MAMQKQTDKKIENLKEKIASLERDLDILKGMVEGLISIIKLWMMNHDK